MEWKERSLYPSPLVDAKVGEKPLSIAIDEMNQGKMTIIAQDEEEEE